MCVNHIMHGIIWHESSKDRLTQRLPHAGGRNNIMAGNIESRAD
jgi:hypothetical protein